MRRKRSDLADWHVFNVGSRSMSLFRDEKDSNVFLARARNAGLLSGVAIWAYTLMTNHFHMVVRGTSEQLRRFMHHLQRLYAVYHNQRYGLRGHAFAFPYGAVRQSGPTMLLRSLAYVFMNPVTAHLVQDPEDWKWTSYRSLMGIGDSRLWLNAVPLLGELNPDPDEARGQILQAIEKRRERIKNKPPSAEPTTSEVHRDQFEWLMERAEERGGEIDDWNPVFLALHWARNLGILRGAVALALGGPLAPAMRSEFQSFRDWLTRHPDRAAALATP